MRHSLIVAAAAAFAAFASIPVNAADSWGPIRVGNQCFEPAFGQGRDLHTGTWGACPQKASVSVAPARKKKKNG